ncbi:MAG: hypothetical protein Q7K33_03925 [Candidatus Berkelbacteria bacterium]|nr:hypothetical protein [Candidatus Berkelbacteria bacterium]
MTETVQIPTVPMTQVDAKTVGAPVAKNAPAYSNPKFAFRKLFDLVDKSTYRGVSIDGLTFRMVTPSIDKDGNATPPKLKYDDVNHPVLGKARMFKFVKNGTPVHILSVYKYQTEDSEYRSAHFYAKQTDAPKFHEPAGSKVSSDIPTIEA